MVQELFAADELTLRALFDDRLNVPLRGRFRYLSRLRVRWTTMFNILYATQR